MTAWGQAMKKLTMVALVAAELASVAPARAADLIDTAAGDSTRTGSFAGARLRVSLDGISPERVRAGLTLAPTVHNLHDGAARIRIGSGLEYGLSDRRGPELSLGGRPVRELAQAARVQDGGRQNVSTVGWVAIGVGVVLVAAVGYGIWFTHELGESVGH
jgi:hypothetical protein